MVIEVKDDLDDDVVLENSDYSDQLALIKKMLKMIPPKLGCP